MRQLTKYRIAFSKTTEDTRSWRKETGSENDKKLKENLTEN